MISGLASAQLTGTGIAAPVVAYSAGAFANGFVSVYARSTVDNNVYQFAFRATATNTAVSSSAFTPNINAFSYSLTGPTPSQVSGDTIVSLTGTAGQSVSFTGIPLGTSWTSQSSYDAVTITALLQNLFGTSFTGTAWLTSKIGPGADSTSVVATAPFTVNPVGNAIDATVTLFSNLHLPPGTYYLILNTPSGLQGTAGWRSTTNPFVTPSPAPTITMSTGVSYLGTWLSNTPLNVFPPATSFSGPSQQNFIFSVTGTPSAPTITSKGVVPIYSSSNTIQAGSWISIYGSNLATGTATWKGEFPTSLGGTSVTINKKPAYLWFVSPGQINLQAPDDAATGAVNVSMTNTLGTVTSTAILGQFGPSFGLLDGKHVAGVILRTDGTGAYGGGTYDIIGPTGTSLGFKTVAAKAGDVLALFGVGFGPTNPGVSAGKIFSGAAPTINPVQVLINNVAVIPLFAGITSAGLYQINIQVPASTGSGDLPVIAIAGWGPNSNGCGDLPAINAESG